MLWNKYYAISPAYVRQRTAHSGETVIIFKDAVQLRGFVSTQGDIYKAAEIARSIKGVTSVKNDMRLK